ncbi:MAG TPA: alpha/beta hydrolase [Acidimicrobiia bacterium]|nr:alpha/beta hydrolase [Acidimicrobiia bacterium]
MGRRLLPLVLVLVACSGSQAGVSTTAPPVTVTSTVTTTSVPAPDATLGDTPSASTTTTLAQPVEEILYEHWRGSFQFRDGLRIDVHAPEVRSNHPIAVMVHGGGWFGGRLDSMGHLADGLAAQGFVVFNASYRTLTQGGAFPSMVEDVACAVAYARDHALDFSTTADHLTLIGYSAGAHLASLVAFSPATFGTACEGGDVPVDAFVGLAGSYDTDVYAFLLQPFYGTAFSVDPEPWRAGNPFTYVSDIDPDLEILLIHGDMDEVVPTAMSENLFLAVEQSGASASLHVITAASHTEVNSPRLVSELIAAFVNGDQ